MAEPAGATTSDLLLGGRLRIEQPAQGYRVAIDPVLLAASVPAEPGSLVLEAGLGVGAAAFCLAIRTGARVVGVERDAEAARLARRNAGALGLAVEVVEGSVGSAEIDDLVTGFGPFSHAMANPPYWNEGSTRSQNAFKAGANHRETERDLGCWCAFLAARVERKGTVTLVLPASRLLEAADALRASALGSIAILPIQPRAERLASRIVIQARKDGRSPLRLEPALTLHAPNSHDYTAEADRILRGAMPTTLGLSSNVADPP